MFEILCYELKENISTLQRKRSLTLHKAFWKFYFPLPIKWASLVAQMVNICLQCGRPGFDPWAGRISWRRKWQPTPVFMPGESHGRRSLVGYSPWGHKESDTTERLHFHFTRKIKTGYVIVFPLTMIFWCIRIIRWMQPIALIKKYLTFA